MAIDLGRWLRDRKKELQGVGAQVNWRDGGKTYDTVINNKQPGYRSRVNLGPEAESKIRNAKYGKLAQKQGGRSEFIASLNRNDTRNSSDYLKPQGFVENFVAATSNLGQYNPLRGLGDTTDYLQEVSEGSRFEKPVDSAIGFLDKTYGANVGAIKNLAKGSRFEDFVGGLPNTYDEMSEFGKVNENSVWAPQNLENPAAKQLAEQAVMLGQTANYAVPGVGVPAVTGTIGSEASDVAKQRIEAGDNPLIAHLKGLASGTGQAAVERYSSKFTTALPGSGFVGNLAKGPVSRIGASMIGGGLTEGAEEGVQGIMGNLARGNKWNQDLGQQVTAGAKGGFVMGGGFGAFNIKEEQKLQKQVEQQNPILKQKGQPAAPGTLRESIQNAKEIVKESKIRLLQSEQGSTPVGGPFIVPGAKQLSGAAQQAQLSKQNQARTKQIHRDDARIMTDFIDHARGITKLSPQQAQELEYNAALVAEGYGLKMPNSTKKLANVFDKELQKQNYGKQLVKQDTDVTQRLWLDYLKGRKGSGQTNEIVSNKNNIQAAKLKMDIQRGLLPENMPKAQREAAVKKLNEAGLQAYFYKPGQKEQRAAEILEEKLTPEIDPTKSKEGGFIAGPLALDFSKQQKQGRVFEGVDGKPRFEVDDSGATVDIGAVYDNNYNANLDQVLKHPELFKQYPQLKKIKVTVDAMDNATNAMFDDKTNTITLNENQLEGMDVEGTILHEIQHGIQNIEGFARGGAVDTKGQRVFHGTSKTRSGLIDKEGYRDNTFFSGKEGNAKIYADVFDSDAVVKEAFVDLQKPIEVDVSGSYYTDLDPSSEIYYSDGTSQTIQDLFGQETNLKGLKTEDVVAKLRESNDGDGVVFKNIRDPETDDVVVVFDGKKVKTPAQYKNLAGEAEARAVASRMNMSDGERYQAPTGKKLYHGTEAEFDEFQVGRPVKRRMMFSEYDTTSNGIFFTDSKAETKNFGRNVKEAIVDIKKPLVFSDRANDGLFNEFDNMIANDPTITDIKPGEPGFSEWMYFDGDIGKKFVEFAKSKGFDGALLEETGELTGETLNTYVAFGPKQIKPSKPQSTFYDSLDVPKEDLIIRDGGGKAMSVEKQPQLTKKDKEIGKALGMSDELIRKAKTEEKVLNQTKEKVDEGLISQEQGQELINQAVATKAKDPKAQKIMDAMVQDKKLTDAARKAQREGTELNYYAKKDRNGRSVGIEKFDPRYNEIQGGLVVDKNGKVLGNHIKVDETGIQVNVGGDIVNIESIIGNPLDWKDNYQVTSTQERNIYDNAPTPEIADKTYKFTIGHKIKSEADFKVDLRDTRKTHDSKVKKVIEAKPLTTNKKQYREDVFDFIESNKTQSEIAKKYGPKSTAAIVEYKKYVRKLYDNLLDRVNAEFTKFGEPTVPKRKDYITHINELSNKPGFAGEVMANLQNSMLGEGFTKTRGEIPGSIAGRTENFGPRKKWNRFFQPRTGGEFTKDPFKAVDTYLEPTLYNIHMTESAVRARAVESAFRTADELKTAKSSDIKEGLNKELEKFNKNGKNSKMVTAFQEYANALAGKSNRADRILLDASNTTAAGLRGWQGLQRIGGRATILGNVNSILMQPLNQVTTFSQTGINNYIKGIARSMSSSKAEDLSPFIKARSTQVDSSYDSKFTKAMNKLGVPMQAVELAAVKMSWNAEYEQVLSEGYKGQEAIIEADRRTERDVAGRGIADKPEVYRSTLANGLFQYTLEVSAQNKRFWKDATPKQKAKFVAGAYAMNQLIGLISGYEPLPDYLDAAIESIKGWFDDEKDLGGKLANTAQRFASETVSFNPFTSSLANLLPKDLRKSLFGSDSDLARFEGTPAPISVIENMFKAGQHASKGEFKDARDDALRVLPGGNQIRKTTTGAELIKDGNQVDAKGNVKFEAPENPLGKLQALLFGPSATKGAQEYYQGMSDKFSGKGTKSETKLTASGAATTVDDFDTIAQAALPQEFTSLTNDEQRKEFARQSPENRAIYDQYKAMQKAFNGGDDLLPAGISEQSEKTLNRYDRMLPAAREKTFYRNPAAEYEYELAKYEKDKLEGKISTVDAIKREKSLAKQQIGSKYQKDIRDVYSLNKTQIKELVEGSPEGKAIYDQLVQYDKELYDAGLISYRKFKNGLGSGRGGGRGGSRRSASADLKKSYDIYASGLSNLNKLLASTAYKPQNTKIKKTAKANLKQIKVDTKA